MRDLAVAFDVAQLDPVPIGQSRIDLRMGRLHRLDEVAGDGLSREERTVPCPKVVDGRPVAYRSSNGLAARAVVPDRGARWWSLEPIEAGLPHPRGLEDALALQIDVALAGQDLQG